LEEDQRTLLWSSEIQFHLANIDSAPPFRHLRWSHLRAVPHRKPGLVQLKTLELETAAIEGCRRPENVGFLFTFLF